MCPGIIFRHKASNGKKGGGKERRGGKVIMTGGGGGGGVVGREETGFFRSMWLKNAESRDVFLGV